MTSRSSAAPPRRFPTLLLPLAALLLGAAPVASQRDTIPDDALALEMESRTRWLHGRQAPGFTPFQADQRWIVLDAAPGRGPGERTLSARLGVFSGLQATARMRLAATGRLLGTELQVPEPRANPFPVPAAVARRSRVTRFLEWGDRLALPEERLWELVPTFPATTPRAGLRWADTLRHEAVFDDSRQALTGVRVSTIVRDTTVGGRRLWVVRDSALVRYEESSPRVERTLDTLVTVSRDARGVLRGRHLYDPATGLFELRHDTVALTGEATLRYPDGRVFRTPARFERTRRWTLHDPPGYTARRARLAAERIAERTGMILLPRGELERRLAAGEAAVRDSLVRAWQAAPDPDHRADILWLLTRWPGPPEVRAELRRLRMAVGDTAAVIREVVGTAHSAPLAADTLRLLLPFMADPGLAFAFGLDRDPFYENIRQGLLSRPPAFTANGERSACARDACAELARQWEVATEPRLRELGLIARLVQAPARWADTVLARAARDSSFLAPALAPLRGIGATWIAASKRPIPAPGARWSDWLEWMSGTDPAYVSPTGTPPWRAPRWGESHLLAVRFVEARTGRDVAREIRSGFEAAASDSARLVLGTILLGLREHRPTPAEVVARLRGSSAADHELGVREMNRLLEGAVDADAGTEARLQGEMLALALDGTMGWSPLSPLVRVQPTRGLLREDPPPTVYVVADGLDERIRARWSGRVRLVSLAEAERRSQGEPGRYLTLAPVRRAGPFAVVSFRYTGLYTRAEDGGVSGYAAGTTAYLLETDAGWMVVSMGGFIT